MLPWSIRKRERLDGLSDLLLLATGATILDVGCHRGLVCYEFAKHGAKLVHGCDINADMIEVAVNLFYDVEQTESRFVAADLRKGAESLNAFGEQKYDIVLLLGVYHKLKRDLDEIAMVRFIENLASRTLKYFAWNGYEEEFYRIDSVMAANGFMYVHRSSLTQHTAVWKRNG